MYPNNQQHHARAGASLVSPRVYPSMPQPTRPHHLHTSPAISEAGGRSAPNLSKVYQERMGLPHSQSVYVANPAVHHNIPPVPRIPSQFAAAHPTGDRRICQPYQPGSLPHSATCYPSGTTATTIAATRRPPPAEYICPPHAAAATPGPLHVMMTPKTDYMPGSFPTTFSPPPSSSSHHNHHHHVPTKSQSYLGCGSGSKKTKKVALFQGNLVLDCPVPSRLIEANPRKDPEFCHMRYSAVTCDPDEFSACHYTLRPRLMNRDTELFIVMTMYNEDRQLFCRTMHGVMKNIAHLCSRSRSKLWNTEGWKKVVVCIVADGRKKCDPAVLDVLATMGVYQKGVAKNMVNDKPVKAHLYEYTTQISVDADMKVKGAERGIVPAQILFCLKEQNAKKINSHRWFFNAFGTVLRPNVCVLLDVGTRPGNTSIYHLWKTFDISPNIAGACGEIKVQTKAGLALLNPIVAAQNFEYKMSNILDKPLESVFGYISVLPGAFSAYRYSALLNDANGTGPLQKYFLGEKRDEDGDSDIFSANMYLAEDRILCFELLAKKHEKWLLRYVQNAFGETDCPDQLPEFLSQRRRWLNGSFFAAIYSTCHFSRIWSTNHTVGRKIALTIEFAFNFINLVFSWLGMANFYLTCYFISKSLASPDMDPFGDGWGNRIFQVLRYLYIFLFIVSFICSMGNRPQGSKWMFIVSALAYAIIMAYTLFAGGWLTYQSVLTAMQNERWDNESVLQQFGVLLAQPGFRNVIISMCSTYGLYILSSLLYLDPWHMITSFVQYMLLLPTYVNLLNVYAFCNTHDVSWGTKGDNTLQMDLGVASKANTTEKGVEAVEVELADEQGLVDRYYEDALHSLSEKHDTIQQSRPRHTKQDDYYRGFRTKLVLAWIGCNALLVAFITSGSFRSLLPNSKQEKSTEEYQDDIAVAYTGFILWTVAATAGFRFLGSILYLLLRCFRL